MCKYLRCIRWCHGCIQAQCIHSGIDMYRNHWPRSSRRWIQHCRGWTHKHCSSGKGDPFCLEDIRKRNWPRDHDKYLHSNMAVERNHPHLFHNCGLRTHWHKYRSSRLRYCDKWRRFGTRPASKHIRPHPLYNTDPCIRPGSCKCKYRRRPRRHLHFDKDVRRSRWYWCGNGIR